MTAIVTATLDPQAARECLASWTAHARGPITYYLVVQAREHGHMKSWVSLGPEKVFDGQAHRAYGYHIQEILGVVPAFAVGVQRALEDGHDVIACLHDDLEITDPGWDLWVTKLFKDNPQVGLCGFGGGVGLGDPDIYQKPYNPIQLARRQFVSNMKDATSHGARSLFPVQVACLDGFSQIGQRDFWMGLTQGPSGQKPLGNLFQVMQEWGIVHHAYDAALGCFAKRLGWDVWMLPIACHHYGGRTAVGNAEYQRWANDKGVVRDARGTMATGDQGFWLKSHQIVYEQFRDVLPIN